MKKIYSLILLAFLSLGINSTALADDDDDKKDFETVDLNSLDHEQARSVGLEHIILETIKKLEIHKPWDFDL